MEARSALFEDLVLQSDTELSGSRINGFLYGCAWKREDTDKYVYKALQTGFRGVDVAAQYRHFREDLVGKGIRKFVAEGNIKRENLFIQSKFAHLDDQDTFRAIDRKRVPYEWRARTKRHAKESITVSLQNLRWLDSAEDNGVMYLDCILLSSPLPTMEETLEAWKVFETFVPQQVKHLGISNCKIKFLKELCEQATIKPSVVQNAFYADTKYDRAVRKFCRENGIVYQCYWTLCSNTDLLWAKPVMQLAMTTKVVHEVVLFALVLGLRNVVICNGTRHHMKQNIDGLEKIKEWALENPKNWEEVMQEFKDVLGDEDGVEYEDDDDEIPTTVMALLDSAVEEETCIEGNSDDTEGDTEEDDSDDSFYDAEEYTDNVEEDSGDTEEATDEDPEDDQEAGAGGVVRPLKNRPEQMVDVLGDSVGDTGGEDTGVEDPDDEEEDDDDALEQMLLSDDAFPDDAAPEDHSP